MVGSIYRFVSEHAFAVVVLWLCFWFVSFYPTRVVSIDEVHYIENARRIVSGTVLHDCEQTFLGTFPTRDGCVSKYNLGASLFLIPAVIIDQRLAAVTSFALFAFAIWMFKKILELIDAQAVWLLFFALYPPFIYFTRTAFSEIYSMTLVLCVVYCVLRLWRSHRVAWLVGASFLAGLTVFTRYTLAVPLAVILLLGILQSGGGWRRRLQLFAISLLAGMPWVLVIGATNLNLYGSVLHSGYWLSGEEVISVASLVPGMLRYFLALNLMYPGMLIGSWWARGRDQLLFVLPVLSALLIYSLSPNNLFEGRILDLILGIRFFVPIAPLIMLGSLPVAERLRMGKYYAWSLPLIVLGLFVLAAIISVVHARFLASI